MYCGLLDVCQPKPGDTVVVSGAAGAVGSLAGQIAKIKGCRTVGIAGTDAKIAYLVNDLGFDAAFNYRTASDYAACLTRLCPAGIDCYFDNVGGAVTDAVLPLMNLFGRVALCGLMSEYNQKQPEFAPRLLRPMLLKQLRVEGFLFTRFQGRWGEAVAQIAQWLGEGRLTYREEIVDWLHQPAARAHRPAVRPEHRQNAGATLIRGSFRSSSLASHRGDHCSGAVGADDQLKQDDVGDVLRLQGRERAADVLIRDRREQQGPGAPPQPHPRPERDWSKHGCAELHPVAGLLREAAEAGADRRPTPKAPTLPPSSNSPLYVPTVPVTICFIFHATRSR